MGRSRAARPGLPSRCSQVSCSRPTEDGTLTLSAFDYEVSRPDHRRRRGRARPARCWCSAGCSPTSRATCRRKPIDVATDGNKVQVTCGSQPVQPADDAGRRLPHAAAPARPPPAPSPATSSPRPSPRSASRPTAATPCRSSPASGSRSRATRSPCSPPTATGWRCASCTWNPEATDASHVALVPARTLSDTAKALGAAGSVEIALGSSGGGDGLIGFEAGQRRATTRLLDGEYPKVTSIFPSSVDTEAVIETAALVEAVKRVALVAERNTPVRLKFTDGPGRHRGRHRRRRPGQRGGRGHADRRRHRDRVQPAVPARRPRRGRHAVQPAVVHPEQPSPAVLSGQAEPDGEADDSLPLRPDAGPLRRAEHPPPTNDDEGLCDATRTDRPGQDGRQHARASAPRRSRGRRLRPQPRGQRRRQPREPGRRPVRPRASCGSWSRPASRPAQTVKTLGGLLPSRRPGHRRRQLPVHRRHDQRRGAGRQAASATSTAASPAACGAWRTATA